MGKILTTDEVEEEEDSMGLEEGAEEAVGEEAVEEEEVAEEAGAAEGVSEVETKCKSGPIT